MALTTGVVSALMLIAQIPSASADVCKVIVKVLATGKLKTLTVNARSAADVQPPKGTKIRSVLCTPSSGTTSTSTSTPTTSTPTTSTSTTDTSSTPTTSTTTSTPTTSSSTSQQPPPKTTSTGTVQPPSHHNTSPAPPSKPKPTPKPKPAPKPQSKPQPAPKPSNNHATSNSGAPTPSNPTFSFALPGPAPIGVPNFFIDSFRIPPFLLPIYQAAGIQYDVPWQVLAAINEIETDYGRNLSVSSAGAVGWMQFLPSTWKVWGMDANGDGVADPYNPVDAIFSAARYLHAAGASQNLSQAIFAYNHADWYVQSVLLRAKLIGGMPSALIGALTGLVEGHFPVAAPSKYADDSVQQLASRRINGSNAAIPIDSNPNAKGVVIFAHKGAPVIAVNDGKVLKIGYSPSLGRYLELQDATGNVYTYAQLGSIPKLYPVPKPVKVTAAQIAKQLAVASRTSPPKAPASAGSQQATPPPTTSRATKEIKSSPATSQTTTETTSIATPMVKERLFAYPSRPASYAAGGAQQVRNTPVQISNFNNYFSDVLHLPKNEYTLKPLKAGAIVVAGTILGRIAAGTPQDASHLWFMIRPAGKNAPQIDPKPILDGWKLLEATAVYRARGVDPFFGPGAKNPTIGQVLLMSKAQLQNRVLADPHVQIYACGRRDIQAGLIDRRILAVIEFLSASGLYPSVSGLECGHSLTASTGVDAAGATGSSVDISAINEIPVKGHQGPGSITDIAVRRLLTLQGAMAPDEIVSQMTYKGQNNTLALPDHSNRIQVTYTPLFGTNNKLSAEVASVLQPGQWIQLINRISQIPEPVVPIAPSRYAIRTTAGAY